jgi:FtsZ-interacting cell division protein ZipA
MWIWIIIAAVVIVGLVFWTRSRKKEEGTDISVTSETPTTPETPEAPAETPDETSGSSSKEEKPM